MRLAVVRETMMQGSKGSEPHVGRDAAVEVYTLPPLSKEDVAAVKAAEAMAPEDSGARIDQALMRESAAAANKAEGVAGANGVPQPGPEDVPPPPPPVETAAPAESGAGSAVADPEPSAPRTRPTLYGPDEKQPKKSPQ